MPSACDVQTKASVTVLVRDIEGDAAEHLASLQVLHKSPTQEP